MKRFIASFLGILMTAPTAFMAPTMAIASSTQTAVGPWVWTDLSTQLTVRTNRPVWAVAYANGNWFYTDGQNLWNGGQVYRYDGYTQTNITSDVRNAGVDRVDDIVTDGETVLFLKDIVRLDNQLSVVTYRNGQYTNITSEVRGMLQSDEGVSSINGRSGEWMVVTTKARLFRLTNNGSATQINLPSIVSNNVPKGSALIYNVDHGADASFVRLAMVPVGSGKWLLAASELGYQSTGSSLSNGAQIGHSLFYTYTNGSFTEAGPGTSTRWVQAVVSNGTQALVMLETLTGTISYANLYSFDGNTWKRGSRYAECVERGIYQPCINVNPARYNRGFDLSWNGRSWMLVNQGKSTYRIDSNLNWTDYGSTQDFFVTVAGDGNGRFLMGGAESNTSWSEPTNPLTAKLVMVTEGVSAPTIPGVINTTDGSDRVYTTSNGPRMTVRGNPADFRVGSSKEFVYQVVAEDPQGVNRIDLYVNGALIRTCLLQDVCEYRTTYWANGNTARTVSFWARATDRNGNATENSGQANVLTVDPYSSASATNQMPTTPAPNTSTGNKKNPAVWDWLQPSWSTLEYNNNWTEYHAGAWDEDGISRIEILVNGVSRRTCDLGLAYGNQECSWRIEARDYSSGASVFMNAKATDRYGNVTWTDGKSVRIGNTY